ncbi:MAG: ribonuclease Z [archaeon]
MIEVTFLGTAASLPTRERNLFSVHVKHLNNRMLFDCGEGTQRQMFSAGISPFKISNVFITHLHADHFLGLAGLIQTLNFLQREEPLHVYGPTKIKKYVDFFSNWDYFAPSYEIISKEVKEGLVFENADYSVAAFEQKHSCPCFGYVFEEKTELNVDKAKFKKFGLKEGPLIREIKEKGKVHVGGRVVRLEDIAKPIRPGKKIVISVDTVPNPNIVKFAKNADVLISEATHMDDLKERSHEYGHMTAKDAARLAKEADVGRLLLSHFSARYEDVKALEKEAREIFKNTTAATDLMTIQV